MMILFLVCDIDRERYLMDLCGNNDFNITCLEWSDDNL